MKLSIDTVKAIRQSYLAGISKRKLAKIYKISRSTMDRVLDGTYRLGVNKCPTCGGSYYTKECIVCKVRDFIKLKKEIT